MELIELFEYIVDHPDDFDEDTVHSADGYTMHLTSFEFCFLLSTFYSILPYSDVLSGILQNREFDTQLCLSMVDDSCNTTEMEKGTFNSIYEDTVSETGVPRGRRTHMQGDVRGQYQQLHSAIIDSIVTQRRNRYNNMKGSCSLPSLTHKSSQYIEKRELKTQCLTSRVRARLICSTFTSRRD